MRHSGVFYLSMKLLYYNIQQNIVTFLLAVSVLSVSYTHLDVYKRQTLKIVMLISLHLFFLLYDADSTCPLKAKY